MSLLSVVPLWVGPPDVIAGLDRAIQIAGTALAQEGRPLISLDMRAD